MKISIIILSSIYYISSIAIASDISFYQGDNGYFENKSSCFVGVDKESRAYAYNTNKDTIHNVMSKEVSYSGYDGKLEFDQNGEPKKFSYLTLVSERSTTRYSVKFECRNLKQIDLKDRTFIAIEN
jgi:hypothetical protein